MIDVTTLVGATRELQDHHISDALVAARRLRHEDANAATLAEAGASGDLRLSPVATVNPVQYLDWRAQLERDFIALRFFPEEQRWTVQSEAFGAIARAARCPLLVPVTRFGDATAIGAATGATPVVLLGAHYTQLGDCFAALERWPHLYLDTSRLAHFRAIETVVQTVGANRVLFGSGAPERPIQAALNAVLSANIEEAEKRAILSDNASRLFGISTQPFALPEPTHAEHLVDVHGHIGALGLPTPLAPPGGNGNGIDLTIASSLEAIADDRARGNAEAFAAIGESLQAYVVVDPNDCAGSCAAMDDAYRRDVALGAKLHCSYSHTPTASRSCVDLLREVARRGRPLKVHVDGVDWDEALACVANEYPAWPVIVAHAGPGTPVRATADLISRTTNVYAELSTSFPDLAAVRDVVTRIGPERLLFGSDAPLLDPSYVLGIYADARANLPRTTDVAKAVFGL